MPYLISISKKSKKLIDRAEGDELKIHNKPTSLMGGLALALSISEGFFMIYDIKAVAFVLGLLPVFLLGLWDDFKWKHVTTIKPRFKFVLLILSCFLSALALTVFLMSVNFVPIIWVSLILSFCWVFVMINAINYQDGMDGLAGSLVFISMLGLVASSLIFQNYFILSISMVVLASTLGFLIYNLPPAKIFMGDSGAYLLGFALSAIAIAFVKPYNLLTVLGVVFIVGLPLFDGVFTNMRRIISGKSIFLGDRSHFYDRLLQGGLSSWKTLFVCWAIQIISVLIGVFILTYA